MDSPIRQKIEPQAAPERETSAPPKDKQDLPLPIVKRGAASGQGSVGQGSGRKGSDAPAPATRFLTSLSLLRYLPLILLLVATGGVIGLYFQPPGLQKAMELLNLEPGAGTSTPIAVPAQKGNGAGAIAATGPLPGIAPGPKAVVGLGRLLPDGDIVTLAPPFGSNDAKIALLKVEEGDRVERGEILAILDNEPELLALAEAAKASVSVQTATLAQTRTSVRASIEEAEAVLAQAEAAAVNAKQEYERGQVLVERKVISQATLDQRLATHDQARREVDRAIAALSRYQTDDIEQQVDVVVARRNLEAANIDLARRVQDLERAYIRAPLSGTVLKIHLQEGEKPGTEGVLNIGNIDRMTVEVEVYQAQISAVSLNDRVTIEADALTTPLTGRVSKIGLEIGRQTLIDDDPAANTDARVIEVTVALDPASSATASRYTNLQVIARISVGANPSGADVIGLGPHGDTPGTRDPGGNP